jgi:hypothetical protein
MTGIATTTVAGPSGSDGTPGKAISEGESRRIPATFQRSELSSGSREKSPDLLDIERSLC